MIKLCASDMDGTLLNNQGQLSSYTIEAMKAVQENGIIFVVITGRADEGVELLLEKSKVNCYRIVMNGAQIKDLNKNLLYEKTIPFDQIEIFYETLKDSGFVYSFYGENCRYTFFTIDEHRIIDERLTKTKMPDKRYAHFYQIHSVEELREKKIFKMEARCENLERIAPLRDKLSKSTNLNVTSAVHFNVEATHKEANKAMALKKLCEMLNISEKDVAIFGDGLNDEILFQSFTETYAVSNACEEVKKLSKYKIGSNDSDAVAKTLFSFILSKD